MAKSEAAEAMPQPASRSGIEETGPGSETGRMNASSSVGVAPARTELTTPAKSTPNATSAIATAATTAEWDATVPAAIITPHASASAA